MARRRRWVFDGRDQRAMLRSLGMTSAHRRNSGLLVIGGLFLIAALTWWLRRAIDTDDAATEPPAPVPPTAESTAPSPLPPTTVAPATPPLRPDRRPSTTAPATPPSPALRQPTAAPATPRPRPELRGHDMIDPCEPAGEPTVPPGYNTITANDITVAWSSDKPAAPGPADIALRAPSVAHLVTGILEEAAAFSGTARRDSLTVVVYPAAEFLALTGAPSWADGAYDGAVRLPAVPSSDLGVSISSLRHEIMHAQLHTGVGCIPAWFNEGSAMHFAGAVPALDWLSLLRAHDTLDLAALHGPVIAEMSADRARRAYAISLAMVLYAIEHTQGDGIQPTVRAALAAGRISPRASLDLWDRLFPGADYHAVQNLLARKLLGAGTGTALDDKLREAVCCYGLRSPGETVCRNAAARPGTRTWTDRNGPHTERCFTVADTR